MPFQNNLIFTIAYGTSISFFVTWNRSNILNFKTHYFQYVKNWTERNLIAFMLHVINCFPKTFCGQCALPLSGIFFHYKMVLVIEQENTIKNCRVFN